MTAARAVASEFIGVGSAVLGAGRGRHPGPTDATGDGVATDPPSGRVPDRRRQRVGERDRRRAPCRTRSARPSSAQTTFGKGTVQQWQELTGEGGAFRLTVARWLTPDKRWIHETGLEPDVAGHVPADAAAGEDPVARPGPRAARQAHRRRSADAACRATGRPGEPPRTARPSHALALHRQSGKVACGTKGGDVQ